MKILAVITLVWLRVVAAQQPSPAFSLADFLVSNGLTSFQTYLNQFPALFDQLSAGNLTILAPSDDAFANYNKSSDAVASNYSTNLQALLQYHVLPGRHPRGAFALTPSFLPTLALNGTANINVAGGQRIEVLPSNHGVVFRSGFKNNSTLITGDIIYEGESANGAAYGVIHIIDHLLTLPGDLIQTARNAGLTNYLALAASSPVDKRTDTSFDWTVFAPNGVPLPSISLANVTTAEELAIEDYHFVPGVYYSSNFTNGTTIKTLSGADVTVTLQDGDIFINDAKITNPDYLISSGVMHVLDKILDPRYPNARPPLLAPQLDNFSSHKLSDAAYAGIGVVAGIALLSIISLLLYLIYRRKDGKSMHISNDNKNADTEEMAKIPPALMEMEAKHGKAEMGLRSPVYEIGYGR